jgi:hypothetical protein
MKFEISIDYGKLDISYSRIFSSLSRHLFVFYYLHDRSTEWLQRIFYPIVFDSTGLISVHFESMNEHQLGSLDEHHIMSTSQSKVETTTMNYFIDFHFSGLSFCLTHC